ncbi:F-box only protein 42-like isoform X2 [Argiope bruennichi]|uniref:F-box only protein 42-like isoform X2 n=1 Tax=Argiope bruennichi TaxID=94029 RepID=UPI0024945539|nr:F-box only protein 42-like isoform X2 [Argiope bruennichi]
MREINSIASAQRVKHSKMKSTVSIEDLPDPIIEYILSYLSPYRDLKQCMQVNKSWYRFVYDVIRKTQRDFYNAIYHMSVQWCHLEAEPGPTITKRYSHSACCNGNSMYIFGGCTTANTTFNDLWRFDLGSRCWIRPLATGTYPPPKACATLVSHSDNLVLFGGWTHTAPYPLHQVWRVFNQIHIYNTTTNRWTQVTTASSCPPMAGHSATVHGDVMVVFGGVQKQICDGPFVSTNDVWTLDLKSYKWQKQVTSNDPPPARYGHSQIPIDKDHLLIVGGCGGPNMLYSDIWLLKMVNGAGGLWEWQKMVIHGKEYAAPQIAFHPACKVGSQVVVMSKSHKSRSSPASLPNLLRAPSRTWVPPRMDDEDSINLRNAKRSASEIDPCVNGKRGVLKRPSDRPNTAKPSQVSSSDEDETLDSTKKVALNTALNSFPLPPQASNKNSDSANDSPSTSGYAHNDVTNDSIPSSASPSLVSSEKSQLNNGNSEARRSSVSTQYSSREDMRQNPGQANSGTCAHTRRNRQRQLEGLDRMEQRLRDLRAGNVSYPTLHKFSRTMKRPMCLYVLDISTAFDGFVTWRAVKNQSPSAPEEIILYSLVLGKGEVIMFGGIQKDLNSSGQEGETVPEVVSNSLHFMTAERFVI